MNKFALMVLGVSVLALPGCTAVGLAAGAGASVGIAASQEGGLSQAVTDGRIQLEINDLWFRFSVEAFAKLDLTVNNGRVLVTGVVQDPEHRVEAIRLAWQPKGVQQVINEVQVAEGRGIVGYAKDTWITTRLRTALTVDREVLSINYSIDTVQGTVYLMGWAQDRTELNRVIENARTISGVSSVVSYVKIISGEDSVQNGPQSEPPAWQDSRDMAPPAATYQSDVATQSPYGVRAEQAMPNGPIVISPQSPSPVIQENLQAREAQKQRIQSGGVQRQGIESEVINLNP
jgi:osmotically-inducible protein OsmY